MCYLSYVIYLKFRQYVKIFMNCDAWYQGMNICLDVYKIT